MDYFVNAELKDNVDVVGILEDTVKLDYKLMMQSFVDFYFGKELLD